MSKCSGMTLALACWNNAGVPTQVFVHNEYRTAANGARTLHATRFTDANGVPVTVNAVDVKPGACSGAATTVENIVSPYNALGDLVGVPVREVREFDASGTLVSTTYYDTVTNAPVTLPATAIAVTTSLAFTPVVVEMCEAGVTFLRKFVYHPSGTLFNVYDTTADGQTGFVASPAATIGRCTTGTGGVTSIGAAGTIAAANTVQNLLAAAARKGYAILNTHATAELWIRNGAAAAIGTGFNLKAGDYYEFPQDIGSYDGVVTIISSTVNATFYVEEYK